ncbi:MAG: Na(+)-translocating NADH-quinone reductase subunit F [Gemmatimonadota bacterium]|nr:MAG: Na(+)-translocating NADH-quinone reductase subunit F [Gemmatimonadota bacterium]
MNVVLIGSLISTALVMVLVLIVIGARRLLVPHGLVRLSVNRETFIDAALGDKLLGALDQGGIHLPNSCSGAGTCGLCRVAVGGAGDVLPVERAKLTQSDIAAGFRLACQVVVRNDLDVTVSADLLAAESWSCTVKTSRTVSPLIKEIVFALPAGDKLQFRAGSYVQVTAPPFRLNFADVAVDPVHEEAWRGRGLRQLSARSDIPVTRAYSVANRPHDTDVLNLNIRLALPPGSRPELPPGVVSSYLFGVKPGDTIEVSGPYGHFFATDSDREMIVIGGGVGMAPLRAIVFDQLENRNSGRTISYWYGARERIDIYYADEMERLAREHKNFHWHVALSDPSPDDAWDGDTGFIHDVVYRRHLRDHPKPAECEYYLCGPPLMVEAVRALLNKLGVAPEDVFYDDFGG